MVRHLASQAIDQKTCVRNRETRATNASRNKTGLRDVKLGKVTRVVLAPDICAGRQTRELARLENLPTTQPAESQHYFAHAEHET